LIAKREPPVRRRRCSFLTLALSAPCLVSGGITETAGDSGRMTELLIGTVSWLATFGLIAAIIAEVFR